MTATPLSRIYCYGAVTAKLTEVDTDHGSLAALELVFHPNAGHQVKYDLKIVDASCLNTLIHTLTELRIELESP